MIAEFNCLNMRVFDGINDDKEMSQSWVKVIKYMI
jgi:hypothetical protein